MSAFLDNTQINYVFFSSSSSSLPLSLSLYREKGGAQQKEEKASPLFISLSFVEFFFWRRREMKCREEGEREGD